MTRQRKFVKRCFPPPGWARGFCRRPRRMPKEMMPLVDKPIIQYGVEEALASGCDQIIIVTGRGKTAIEDHFDISYELEKTLEERGKTDLLDARAADLRHDHIAYMRQKEAMGLGHAVLMARELVGDEPFAVILPDDIIDAEVPCLKQMIEIYNETGCSVLATQVVEGKAISAYGVLDAKPVPGKWNGRLFEVQDLVEKPKLEDAPSNLAIIGRYILTPAIFEMLASTQLGARRRTATDRRPEAAAEEREDLRLHLRRQASRCRRQAGLPEGHGRVRAQARGPGRRLSRVSEDAEAVVAGPRNNRDLRASFRRNCLVSYERGFNPRGICFPRTDRKSRSLASLVMTKRAAGRANGVSCSPQLLKPCGSLSACVDFASTPLASFSL